MTGLAGVSAVVADRHQALLHGLSVFLESRGARVVAARSDGADALAAISELQPQLAIVGARLPGLTGAAIAERVAAARVETAVVVYAPAVDPAGAAAALEAGAAGVLLKDAPLEELERALELALRGSKYLDPVLAAAIIRDRRAPSPGLSVRELEILRRLADGSTGAEIAETLRLSPETIRTHLQRAMSKLDAATRTHAVAVALRHGLIR